jgi:hypothetical protein
LRFGKEKILADSSIAALLHSGLGDSTLLSFAWTGKGEPDLMIDLELPQPIAVSGDTYPVLHLYFVWATGLTINMDFGRHAGAPLLWEATFSRTPGSRWRFYLSAPPEGGLSFECNEVRASLGTREDTRLGPGQGEILE